MENVASELVSIALFNDFKQHIYAVLVCGAVTFTWSILWPNWIKDDDGQKLPRSSLARSFFALSIVLLYITLLSIAFLLPELFKNLSSVTVSALVQKIGEALGIQNVKPNAPISILIFMGVLYGIPQVRELMERWAYFLYASQYRRTDELALQHHLESCEFEVSREELRLNKAYVEQFDVFVLDNNASVIQDETVDLWRKTSSLLRLAEADLLSETPVLSHRDRVEFERLQEAHKRKTRLALNIIRMLNPLASSGTKVARIASTLSDVSADDRVEIDEAEAIVKRIAGSNAEAASSADVQGPLRITSHQLGVYLSQISSYFQREYQMLLIDVSRLTAKAIVRAGDDAPRRLESVKSAGFMGLGNIEKQSFDGVLWVLLLTWSAVFTSFLVTFVMRGLELNPGLLFSIALTVAVSATIGSLWGARRSLVERRDVPWSSYLTAGGLSVVVFCLVHGIRFVWGPDKATKMMIAYRPEAAEFTPLQFLAEIWPFSLTLVFLVVGICVLARFPRWPWSGRATHGERLSDGVFVGLIYMVGNVAAMIAHYSLQTAFGERLRERIAEGQFPFFMFLVSFTIGFIIGYAVLREVRRVAHSHVIDPDGTESEARPQSTPVRESEWPAGMPIEPKLIGGEG